MTPTIQSPTRTTLITAALLGATLVALPANARAQTGTQSAEIVMKVPVRMTHIFPEVTAVAIRCRVWGTTTQVGDATGPWTPISQLQRGTDGALTGELSVTVPVIVPTFDAGKTGTYQCYMMGQAGQTFGTFSGSFPNAWFDIVAPNAGDGIVKGTLTL
jgi:hypothetical protein